MRHLDRGGRTGAQFPVPERLWKLGTVVKDDRQTFLWARFETDPRVRAHQGSTWAREVTPISDATIFLSPVDRTRVAVSKFRAPGGEVVFVRPPSAPELGLYEEKTIPQGRSWGLLLAGAPTCAACICRLPHDARTATS